MRLSGLSFEQLPQPRVGAMREIRALVCTGVAMLGLQSRLEGHSPRNQTSPRLRHESLLRETLGECRVGLRGKKFVELEAYYFKRCSRTWFGGILVQFPPCFSQMEDLLTT